jgi:cyclophilin family peptidyl-prolyl cis-trans isomerase
MKKGSLVFNCMGGQKNARATQIFILKQDMPSLDSRNYVPLGRVVKGMAAVEAMHEYNYMVNNGRIRTEGNAYLLNIDPEFTEIETARVVPG